MANDLKVSAVDLGTNTLKATMDWMTPGARWK